MEGLFEKSARKIKNVPIEIKRYLFDRLNRIKFGCTIPI